MRRGGDGPGVPHLRTVPDERRLLRLYECGGLNGDSLRLRPQRLEVLLRTQPLPLLDAARLLQASAVRGLVHEFRSFVRHLCAERFHLLLGMAQARCMACAIAESRIARHLRFRNLPAQGCDCDVGLLMAQRLLLFLGARRPFLLQLRAESCKAPLQLRAPLLLASQLCGAPLPLGGELSSRDLLHRFRLLQRLAQIAALIRDILLPSRQGRRHRTDASDGALGARRQRACILPRPLRCRSHRAARHFRRGVYIGMGVLHVVRSRRQRRSLWFRWMLHRNGCRLRCIPLCRLRMGCWLHCELGCRLGCRLRCKLWCRLRS
mmetsp:Transcript_63273/g.181983  ORF Transcript_63273/g.181983 Transcript_63273/m.181983 type:complete len:320 (+) Transcript_63273:412-1371(+)